MSTYFCISVILCSGWSFQITKCNLEPVRQVQYLGYLLDSSRMIISLPIVKIQKVLLLLDKILSAYENQVKISAKELAAFLGRLSHSYFSHGNFVKIVSRNSNHELGLCVVRSDWNSFLFISNDMYNELCVCKIYFESFNGQPIQTEEMKFEVISPSQITLLMKDVDPRDVNLPRHIFVSGI